VWNSNGKEKERSWTVHRRRRDPNGRHYQKNEKKKQKQKQKKQWFLPDGFFLVLKRRDSKTAATKKNNRWITRKKWRTRSKTKALSLLFKSCRKETTASNLTMFLLLSLFLSCPHKSSLAVGPTDIWCFLFSSSSLSLEAAAVFPCVINTHTRPLFTSSCSYFLTRKEMHKYPILIILWPWIPGRTQIGLQSYCFCSFCAWWMFNPCTGFLKTTQSDVIKNSNNRPHNLVKIRCNQFRDGTMGRWGSDEHAPLIREWVNGVYSNGSNVRFNFTFAGILI